MTTLDALGLIGIGVAIGFILTKGIQLSQSVKKKVKEDREKTSNKK